ncbi:lipolytic protein [Pseudomonas psychrotolerans L19]|uniref:SGNH/GDSL hydrolase family protein n=1 Tax=Pseudomonas TaxID=286 RepID=UPI00023A2645|nr:MULTISPECIES: SGNH/GDSL hydrolase family protein [Pseudomonas]EHK69295.1 lipolytic protein [Pseudomonas psychrotolerans L19]MBA1181207.1 SGNH/GDSL hydrolase family protein [Pseudomonas psychrotolerans]MBA1212739.1 SGNH/GDSL hydrolase family protein [Pseudomonas psychrotolerans]TCQ86435.1 lysophospholipase L1-like esterase [Pseudomonas sp. JUb52]
MPLRTLLCYGDSNTHGTRPLTQPGVLERFSWDERWTGVLARGLGADWRVIEEGLPARTTVHDDPIDGHHKNGLTYLRPCLESQLPVDVLLLMLGTNDLKARLSVTPADIASALQVLLEEIRRCSAGPGGAQPRLIVMAPAPIEEVGFLGEIFADGAAKSRELAARYRQVAEAQGATFVDAGELIRVSPVDGVHFEADQHRRLGEHLTGVVRGVAGH